MGLKQVLERARYFFGTRIWSARLENAGRGRVFLYRLCRTVYSTVQGFREKNLTSRAAALTYYTVLSIVPFLAFAFSVVKGFGAYQKLMDESLRPYLRRMFAGNASLLQALEQMLSFVEATSVSGLSAVGVLLLVYTSISMLSTVEAALNDIWQARSSRPLLRRVTDYTTLMVIGPLLVLVALTFGATAQSSAAVSFLRHSLRLGVVIDFLLSLSSVVLGCVALVALYIIMPNVRTRLSSALFGGIIGGLLWQGALFLHVKFQVGVASYNALYSGFAAVPIFLVWLYFSWNIVLIGAQLAASHQHERSLQQAIRARHVDQELREILTVAVAAAVSRRFLEGRPPLTCAAIASALEAPPPVVEEVLDALVRAGLLVRVVQDGDLGYDPGRDLDGVRMVDLENAVRRDPSALTLKSALERNLGAALAAILRTRHEQGATGPGNLTLRQLAAESAIRIEAPTVESQATSSATGVLDGKQPGVPA